MGTAMIPAARDTHSVSSFKRDSSGVMAKLKKSKRPLALTVKGQVKAVLLDPAIYERMADRLDAISGIRRGLVQAKKGLGRPAGEVLDEIEHDLARG